MTGRWSTGRIEAFSDGVFAIAITLLVLEIGVPAGAFDDLTEGILDQWSSYFAYATSFITIGGIWMAHHGVFRRLQHADGTITRINLLLLMLVSFLPFPTRLLAEAIDEPDAERVAVIFYGLVLLTISVTLAALWRHIATHRDLLRPEVGDAEVAAINRAAAPNIGFYALIVLLAFTAPRAAAFGYLVVAVQSVFRTRGDEPLAHHPG